MTQDAAQDTRKLHDAVRSIVLEELEIEPEELTQDALFEEEYDADSLSLLAIVARFEKELHIVVPSDRVGEMVTFGAVLAVVDEFTQTTAHV